MNQNLWERILQFKFDDPPSEYSFTIRLADENYWTKNFTEQAILEYRKFMYMAATSEQMVSPSEIVDAVWHQHLIFTQSYAEFCKILGKTIQHVPSTHTREEFQAFKQAKERTLQLYQENFGAPPQNIWGYNDMYEQLHLPKAKLKIRGFVLIGILLIVLLTVPCYYLLRPLYVQIDNPYFMQGFVLLGLASIGALEVFNRRRLRQIVNRFDKDSFMFRLQPAEVVYLKTQDVSQVVNAAVNPLVENEIIRVYPQGMELAKRGETNSVEELQITTALSERGRISYPMLLYALRLKPVFRNTANCMDAFQKYFVKSKAFGRLFYLNFGVFAILFLISFARFSTGLLRDRAVTQVGMAVIVLIVVFIFFLNRLTKLVCTDIIPKLYRQEILPGSDLNADPQWQYFLLGTSVLVPAFARLAKPDSSYGWGTDSSTSSCGTSCGSSCGSSCGGCGGGD